MDLKWSKPFLYLSDDGYRWKQAFSFGAFVFLFLWIFQPFLIGTASNSVWLVCLGYGLVTFVSMVFLNIVVPRMVSSFFEEENWTVGKQIIWTAVNISFIGLANYFFFSLYGGGSFSWGQLVFFQGATLAVGVIPSTILILIAESRDRKKYEYGAGEINKMLSHEHRSETSPSDRDTLVIPSLTTDEDLVIARSDLYFIKAADNYIEVYYHATNELKRRVLRNSLKAAEQALAYQADLFRCHKSYLVNLTHVNHLSGNAQGYKLHLNLVDEPIPVSQQHNETIKNRFAIHP